jgi:hypothetical protein
MVQVLKRGICAWMQYIPLVCMVQKNDKWETTSPSKSQKPDMMYMIVGVYL